MHTPSLLTLNNSLLIKESPGPATQLILLFHGVGSTPQSMLPLGEQLAAVYPQACVVSLCAPERSNLGGYQWFSVEGITDDNRLARVQEAMPLFLNTVLHWQQTTGVPAERTALIGFSQGAIMALESIHADAPPAARVVSLCGRFVRLPEPVNDAVTFYLLHGKDDPVIPYAYTVTAAEYLVARHGDVSADVLPFVGHEITPEMIELLLERLQSHVPRRLWQEAMLENTRVVPKDTR